MMVEPAVANSEFSGYGPGPRLKTERNSDRVGLKVSLGGKL